MTSSNGRAKRAPVAAMTPEEYEQALDLIGSDHISFARFAGVSLRTAYRWRDYGLMVPASTLLQGLILQGLTLAEADGLFERSGLEKQVRKMWVKDKRTGKRSQIVGQVIHVGVPAPKRKDRKSNDGGSGNRASAPSGRAHEIAGP